MNSSHQQPEVPMDIVPDRITQDGDPLKYEDETEAAINGVDGAHEGDRMDISDPAVMENVNGIITDDNATAISPLQTDAAVDNGRPASSSAESFDGEKIDEDDDCRAEGTITFTVPDVRKLSDVGTLSAPIQVRNLPWRIMVMKRKQRSANHLHEDPSTLGYFLQCNVDGETTSWTCHAQAELRLIPWKTDKDVIKRQITHMFYNKENDWGFTNFLSFEELLDPAKGLINPQDYSLSLQVTLSADPPHGVCWDSKKYTGYIGLKNQGATCYMNSLLQALYFTNKLRKAVYLIPTEADDPVRSVPLAIQRVFYELQTSDKPVGTKKLTKSFGWETLDSFMQHDAQELCRVLLDNMDMKMKATRVEGTIPRLFEGKMISFIRCKFVNCESSREESFMDVQLNVKDRKDVYESFDDYVELEMLEGDNKYDAGDHGLQDAEKGIRFISFPPVLHLQLKRFQFDPISENNIKINDRFEFPERLDLTKYVQVPATHAPIYFLHAVLVHSGDNHGGHYVVYINPKGDGKWCKFDDDVVVRCMKKEAIERNYGGAVDEFLQFRNCTNAYMLVYINESLRGDILHSVTEEDVPGYLSMRFFDEKDNESKKRKEKVDQASFLNLRVVTEDDMAVHQGAELVDLEKMNNRKPFRFGKNTTCAELCELLAEWFGCTSDQICYWYWINRQNGSVRPQVMSFDVLRSSDTIVTDIGGEEEDILIFLEILPFRNRNSAVNQSKISPNRRALDDHIMLFFRLYDPVHRVLEYKGFDFYPNKLPRKDLLEACNQKAGFPSNTPLLVFNDIKAGNVEKVITPDLAYGRYTNVTDVSDGDLIVFQKTLTPEQEADLSLPTVKDYFKDLTFRTDVEFADKERPNDESCTFSLTLNLKMTYPQVVGAVAAKLRTDPKRVQLFRCQNALRESAGSAINCASDSTLHQLLQSRLGMTKPRKLFYQHLDMDIDELESRKEVKIVWQPNYREEGREYTVLVNKRGTISDVLDLARKQIDLNPEGTGQLRYVVPQYSQPEHVDRSDFFLCYGLRRHQECDAAVQVAIGCVLLWLRKLGVEAHTIRSHSTRFVETGPSRMHQLFNKNVTLENVSSLSGNRIFRVEEIPTDQLRIDSDEHLIAVAHFHKEIHQTFGIPFYLKIKAQEEFKDVKERIRKLLDVPEKDFEKYKFCVWHMGKQIPLEDRTFVNLKELFPAGTVLGQVINQGTWLGIDHVNRTPKRPRPSYLEKAVKIYN